MRVGLFVDHFDPRKGGLETALAQLAERLAAHDHEAIVYCQSAVPGAPGQHVLIDDVPTRRGERERVLAARSVDAARGDGCDVTLAVRHCPEVDVYWPHGGAHSATLAAGEAAKRGPVGAVSRLLHQMSARHRVFLELEEAALTGGARRVWCVSELVRRELTAAYPDCGERLEMHPNGVDRRTFHPGLRETWKDRVRAELGVPDGAPVALFMGGNLRLKGWDVLRDALTAATELPWTCVVAGADVDRIVADTRSSVLAERVVAVPHRPAIELFGAADLLVQPTYRDPCSLATLEALASGVPVLTTSANGAADALTRPEAGEAVAVGDPIAFAGGLRKWLAIVANAPTRAEVSAAARQCTDDRDADAWLDGMVASLERLAAD